jgi:uncharacterized protein DUF5309
VAAGTNTYQIYQTVGIREDLIDLITNISPSENMFTKMSGTGKARQTYHEWQTDALATPTANAHVEGEVASAALITPTVRTGNYTQILVKDFSVTDTNEAVNHAGRASEIAYQKAKYLKDLSNDIEWALIAQTANSASSGASATARQLKGVLAWITTNVVTATTATSASGVNETQFNDLLQLIWAQGGVDPYTALVGQKQKRSISAFTGNNTRFNRIEEGKIQSTVDVYESDFGKVAIKKHRVMQSFAPGQVLILGDMDLWKKAWLRQKGWEMMARTGAFQHWHIESELTLEALQEKGSGKLTGFLTS